MLASASTDLLPGHDAGQRPAQRYLSPCLGQSLATADHPGQGWVDAHQDIERLLVLPAHHPFLGDKDPGEEGLVHLFTKLRSGCEVGLVAVLGPSHCPFDDPFDLSQTRFGLGQGTLRGLHVSGDALLLDLQQIEWDGTGVVGVQQLGSFVIE